MISVNKTLLTEVTAARHRFRRSLAGNKVAEIIVVRVDLDRITGHSRPGRKRLLLRQKLKPRHFL